MLLRVGEGRSAAIDLKLAILLSAVAGSINAVGFHAVGLFSANMTGNISALSDYLARASWSLALISLAIVALFILGAFFATVIVDAGSARGNRGAYARNILVEGMLLLALGTLDLALPSINSNPVLVAGLSFLMGLQNATTTLISNARVRTTHVSGMATDTGIELATLCRGERDPRHADARRLLLLHLSTLGAFFIGGVAGAMAYLGIGGLTLVVIGSLLVGIAAPYFGREP